jgi:hypothetical protein
MAGTEGLVEAGLVWDYDTPDAEHQDEAFRRWTVARVLTRGRSEDIRVIGLDTIHTYPRNLVLPPRIRRFWGWYFGLPDLRERHGIADSSAA